MPLAGFEFVFSASKRPQTQGSDCADHWDGNLVFYISNIFSFAYDMIIIAFLILHFVTFKTGLFSGLKKLQRLVRDANVNITVVRFNLRSPFNNIIIYVQENQ